MFGMNRIEAAVQHVQEEEASPSKLRKTNAIRSALAIHRMANLGSGAMIKRGGAALARQGTGEVEHSDRRRSLFKVPEFFFIHLFEFC